MCHLYFFYISFIFQVMWLLQLVAVTFALTTVSHGSCTGRTCSPVVGKGESAERTTPTMADCSAVVLSPRIILTPAKCLWNIEGRRKHSGLKFVQGHTKISITQVSLLDKNGSKSLAVGLLQSASGSDDVTSGLTWSKKSIEDKEILVPKQGEIQRSEPQKNKTILDKSHKTIVR